MIDVQKLEMEILTRTELDRLEHRIGYARAKLDQGAHDLVGNVVPKARLKKLVSADKKTQQSKKFKATIPMSVEVIAGCQDDYDGEGIGLNLDWEGDDYTGGISEQIYDQLTIKKFLASCPRAKAYIEELQALEKWVTTEVRSICKDYHLDNDDVQDYIYDQEDE